MDPDLVWYDVAPGHGVLELHERRLAPPGLALVLHVVVCSDGTGTFAWWELEQGGWLGEARVGSA